LTFAGRLGFEHCIVALVFQELPDMTPLSYKPQAVAIRQHDLRLRWRNWNAYVSPNMQLLYRLQYKEVLSEVSSSDQELGLYAISPFWLAGKDLESCARIQS
jgi:hypothetical protein